MYAIVEIGGQQHKVEEGDELYVQRRSEKEGKKVEFDEVLLIGEDGKVQVGTPTVKGAKVKGEIASHERDEKIRITKMKPRNRDRKQMGHRQDITKLKISKIVGGKGTKKSKSKKKGKKKTKKKKSGKKKSKKKKKKKSKKKTKKGAKSKTKSPEQVSTDMKAKEAINHIKNTSLEKLKGFVPDDEERVTVLKAWENKQKD